MAGARKLVVALRYSPDGRMLAGGTAEGSVVIWNLTNGQSRELWRGHDELKELQFSSDGRWLIARTTGGEAAAWDLVSTREIAFDTRISAFAFTPDATRLVTGGTDATVRLWNLADGQLLSMVRADTAIGAIELSRDGRYVAVGSHNGLLMRVPVTAFLPYAPSRLQPFLEPLSHARLDERGQWR